MSDKDRIARTEIIIAIAEGTLPRLFATTPPHQLLAEMDARWRALCDVRAAVRAAREGQ